LPGVRAAAKSIALCRIASAGGAVFPVQLRIAVGNTPPMLGVVLPNIAGIRGAAGVEVVISI
jgi:hypothetical protein